MADFIEDEIYPLKIVSDRYSGAYSGGNYTAWNLLAEDIPPAIDGDDVDCHAFWLENKIPVGKGRTVSEALVDLYTKLKRDDSPELTDDTDDIPY